MNETFSIYNENLSVRFRNERLAALSKEAYTESVKQFYQFIESTQQIENMAAVLSWISRLKTSSYLKPSTVNLRIRGLKDYLLKKYENDITAKFWLEQAFKGIRLVNAEKAVNESLYLKIKDVENLTAQMTQIMSLITNALFWTGCKVSELINIKHADCQIRLNSVYCIIKGKGNKNRFVQMPIELYIDICSKFSGNVYLFENNRSRKYNRTSIFIEIKRQAKRYGYNIHPHTLRHSIAKYLKDIKHQTPDQISQYLGHCDIAITLRYYFNTDSEKLKVKSEK